MFVVNRNDVSHFRWVEIKNQKEKNNARSCDFKEPIFVDLQIPKDLHNCIYIFMIKFHKVLLQHERLSKMEMSI